MIGDSTAERIKKEIGTAKAPDHGQGMSMPIKGRDNLSGVPKEITVTEAMVADASPSLSHASSMRCARPSSKCRRNWPLTSTTTA
jgi:actin-like ATPase involved in cell morphogenesis